MTNALVHRVTVEASEAVETTAQLIDRLVLLGSGDPSDDYLDETYVIEALVEKLSDGSEKRSIRIRLAERV